MPDFEFVGNPDLKYIADYKGNKFANGRFYNEQYRKQPQIKEVVQWKMAGNPQKREKQNDDFRLAVLANNQFFNKNDDMIVWLGHASFFIRLNGVNIITDPCFYDMYFINRLANLPCKADEIKNIDYILLSHGHRDHFDVKSLKVLTKNNPTVKFLCPLKIGELIKKYIGDFETQEAGWYQQFSLIKEIDMVCLPAIHWNRRLLTDFNNQLWASFWLKSNTTSIYFGGDSAFGPHYTDIEKVMGSPAIAILGIGAYKPQLIMQSSHTSPNEAVEACNLLGAKHFIPMHYGTYDLSDEPISEPITTVKTLKSDGTLKAGLINLKIGEQWGC